MHIRISMMMKSKGFKAELLKKNAETEKYYHQAFSFGIYNINNSVRHLERNGFKTKLNVSLPDAFK